MRFNTQRTHKLVPFASILVLLLLYVQAASALDLSRIWPTTGVGAVVNETRTVGRFDSLNLSTDARVIIQQGDHNAVEVKAEENIAPLIDTYVENGTLVIENIKHFKSSHAEVVVTLRNLKSIATTGSVAVVAQGMTGPLLSLRMGGSSAVTLTSVSIGKMRVALGGSSALKLSGNVEDFSADLGGSSALQASELAANSVSVNGGGSAQATVWAKQSLHLSLGGSSGVSYYGNVHPSLSTSGSATVKSMGGAPF